MLLKHLIIQSSSSSQTGVSTPLTRTNSSLGPTPGKEDETISIALDDISNYSQSFQRDPIGRITWRTRGQDAIIRVTPDPDSALETRLKKKHVESVVHPQPGDPEVDIQSRTIQQWFKAHPEVRPLVKTWFKRTRFVGHALDGFVWAFMDRDIKLRAMKDLENCISEEEGPESVPFPHAVCQVRWNSSIVPAVVEELRHSYLVSLTDISPLTRADQNLG